MAAGTTTYFESGRTRETLIAERNAELMGHQLLLRRRFRTPEVLFVRHIDNSRVVKAPDPVRVRQMRSFSCAVAVLFSLIMIYGLQHFYAIESSYRVESEKLALEQLREDNRQLRLTQAELAEPGRIDQMARAYGLAAPQPGQVVQAGAHADAGAPALAQMTPPTPPAR